MQSDISDSVVNAALAEILTRYGGSPNKVQKFPNGIMNYVYEISCNRRPAILRVAKKAQMTFEMTMAEIHWIDYLYENGMTVCRAIKSRFRKEVEVVETECTKVIAVVFQKALGRTIDAEDWNEGLFTRMGQMMGKMHALSKNYDPFANDVNRFEWDNSIYMNIANESIPSDHLQVWERCNELLKRIRLYQKDRSTFGLIHCDFHAFNFNVTPKDIYLYDFDGCEYNWFVNDIAVSLFYALLFDETQQDADEKVKGFMSPFLNGYLKENSLDAYWIKQIPTFLKLREFIVYGLLYNAYKLGKLRGGLEEFMRDRKSRIESNAPYCPCDIG